MHVERPPSHLFGSSAIVGSLVASVTASRRRRGPVALRPDEVQRAALEAVTPPLVELGPALVREAASGRP